MLCPAGPHVYPATTSRPTHASLPARNALCPGRRMRGRTAVRSGRDDRCSGRQASKHAAEADFGLVRRACFLTLHRDMGSLRVPAPPYLLAVGGSRGSAPRSRGKGPACPSAPNSLIQHPDRGATVCVAAVIRPTWRSGRAIRGTRGLSRRVMSARLVRELGMTRPLCDPGRAGPAKLRPPNPCYLRRLALPSGPRPEIGSQPVILNGGNVDPGRPPFRTRSQIPAQPPVRPP